MISKLQKLTDGMIFFSALISDYEKLDFKNDALGGVRANYFNSNNSSQSEKTEVVFDGKIYNLSYFMIKNEPLSWKITRNNRPFQTVKRATGGIYCVIVYGDNGIINKRQYFDEQHNWIRTEYYDKNFENILVATLYPKTISGISILRLEQIDVYGERKITDLYPSSEAPTSKCTGLAYSNIGMVWYDKSFKPEGIEESEITDTDKPVGFNFKAESFVNTVTSSDAFDITTAEYLEEVNELEISEITTEINVNSGEKYSAYDKIEKILTEAHKSNKDLFGEILNHTSEDIEDNITDESQNEILEETAEADSPTQGIKVTEPESNNASEKSEAIIEENVVYEITEDNLAETSSGETEDIADSTQEVTSDKSSEYNEAVTDIGFEQAENPDCDVVIHTKTGKYSYYGELDSNNCRTGRGRTVTPQGLTSYDGDYKDDKRHGFGICYYKEGEINYVGNWNNGNRCGCGVGYRLSDGTLHAGKWSNNTPDGFGARFDKDGNFIDACTYSNGVRNGKSISFDENGNIIIKKWKDGELISEFVVKDEE